MLLQLRQANEQLVLETLRTDELAERACESDRAKDAFLAMLSHELRNPLTPIMTALELMAMHSPASFPEERAVIERQVKHLVRLVDDLLDIARITHGKLELHREPIALADVLDRASEMIRPQIEAKGHALVIHAADDVVADADPARLAQIASNLLSNAARYTPSGGRIEVTCERVGSEVVLRVEDNGVGIPADALPRVFDVFAQGLDRAEGGLGLGLAIVKTLVELHGGSVVARSEGLGRGTELVVRLPAAEPARRPTDEVAQAAPTVARKILVVDDSRDIVNLLGRALTELGHVVRVASDGPSALAIVESFTPDVALLDIGLPGMDGYQLAQALEAKLGPVRFVALSGYGQDTARLRSSGAGFAQHLVKPISLEALEAALR